MTILETRVHILKDAGYAYSPERDIYVNRKKKKVFSMDFVEDHDEEEISKRIEEPTNTAIWSFYFNGEIAPSVKRELERLLG